ncbi:MAG: response regulator [Betaproteobacteria bacterium]|nr:response regulator [Betaproteobacteria bacterium]
MGHDDAILAAADSRYIALEEENRMLRAEIRVAREAAEITTKLVVEQFEKTDAILNRFQDANARLVESNDELEAAKQRLQKLDQLKSDFLSSVSHELRTPLTSIRGFAHLVEREFSRSFSSLAGEDSGLHKKSERIRENLAIILKESDRLTRLINDVLDLAKIEAGRVEWRDTLIQTETLVHDAVNAARGMFDQKPGIELKIEIQEKLPSFIGDADRMLQVLVNLLNNAVKFTDQGMVTVKTFLNAESLIQIEVIDSGIGFPPEDADAIFDKFQQAKHGDTLMDRPAGTGLGLSISREIVERHGGRIKAQSQPGKGSTFTLSLPPAAESMAETTGVAPQLAPVKDKDKHLETDKATPSGSVDKPKVLVVDDDAGVRDYLAQLLQEQGYNVVMATDGQTAIATARAHRPDLITMDIAMPVMDGRIAITKLRADPELQHIPIMVVSAISGWETAGGDMAMAKPLDESRFLKNIHLLLNGDEIAEPKKIRFLVIYEMERNSAMAPSGFTAHCEMDFCPVDELSSRIQSGFQGMVAIPVNLLSKIDLNMLNAAPSLEVMIMPVPVAACEADLKS